MWVFVLENLSNLASVFKDESWVSHLLCIFIFEKVYFYKVANCSTYWSRPLSFWYRGHKTFYTYLCLQTKLVLILFLIYDGYWEYVSLSCILLFFISIFNSFLNRNVSKIATSNELKNLENYDIGSSIFIDF